MNRIIKADLYRYGGLQGIKGFIKGLRIPGFRYIDLLRKSQNLPNTLQLIYFILFC